MRVPRRWKASACMLPRLRTSCSSRAATWGSCRAPRAAAGPVSKNTAGGSPSAAPLRARGGGRGARRSRGAAGEGAQVGAGGAHATEVVEAEQAVGVAGRGGAVVQATERQAVEPRVHVE